jgi:hypothetical protein
LADVGLRLRTLEKPGCLSLESSSAEIGDAVAAAAYSAARSLGLSAQPVLTYLANSIRVGKREIPYSVVTALDSRPRSRGRRWNHAERLGGSRPGSESRRSGDARILRLALRRAPAHRDGAIPRGADRATGRRRGRRRLRSRLSRHHRIQKPPRLGSAVPARHVAHTAGRRAILGSIPHRAESLRAPRARARTLGDALRQPDFDSHLPAVGCL